MLAGGEDLERGRMPGAADHRDVGIAFSARLAYGRAHVSLSSRFVQRRRLHGLTDAGDGFGDGPEHIRVVAALLDHALPPAFRVRLSGGLTEQLDWVRWLVPFARFRRRQHDRHW